MKQEHIIVYDVRKNKYTILTERELETLEHKYGNSIHLDRKYPFARITWRKYQFKKLNFFIRLYYLIRFYVR